MTQLCAFLGCDVPDVPFPHANDKQQEKVNPPLLAKT